MSNQSFVDFRNNVIEAAKNLLIDDKDIVDFEREFTISQQNGSVFLTWELIGARVEIYAIERKGDDFHARFPCSMPDALKKLWNRTEMRRLGVLNPRGEIITPIFIATLKYVYSEVTVLEDEDDLGHYYYQAMKPKPAKFEPGEDGFKIVIDRN